MGTELFLRYMTAESLLADFEANLRKGRAFVPGHSGLVERDLCTLCVTPPAGGEPLRLRAEAVWIGADPDAGTGLALLDFDASAQEALSELVERVREAPAAPIDAARAAPAAAGPSAPATPEAPDAAAPTEDDGPGSSSARYLHDRIRQLDLVEREGVARQGSLPERVALERRYGSSVWEGLLHNPQITAREILRMAKSTSLPTHLVGSIVSNRAWLSDPAVARALLENPRVAGVHLERVLRMSSQADLLRLAEQSSLRLQVRQAAKRLIRR